MLAGDTLTVIVSLLHQVAPLLFWWSVVGCLGGGVLGGGWAAGGGWGGGGGGGGGRPRLFARDGSKSNARGNDFNVVLLV